MKATRKVSNVPLKIPRMMDEQAFVSRDTQSIKIEVELEGELYLYESNDPQEVANVLVGMGVEDIDGTETISVVSSMGVNNKEYTLNVKGTVLQKMLKKFKKV